MLPSWKEKILVEKYCLEMQVHLPGYCPKTNQFLAPIFKRSTFFRPSQHYEPFRAGNSLFFIGRPCCLIMLPLPEEKVLTWAYGSAFLALNDEYCLSDQVIYMFLVSRDTRRFHVETWFHGASILFSPGINTEGRRRSCLHTSYQWRIIWSLICVSFDFHNQENSQKFTRSLRACRNSQPSM